MVSTRWFLSKVRRKIAYLSIKFAHRLGFHVHPWPSNLNLAVDYPVSIKPRYGHDRPTPPAIMSRLEAGRERYRSELTEILARKDLLESIPPGTDDAVTPFWQNRFFSSLDAAALMHLVIKTRPSRYIEIGSGNSTKFVRHAVKYAGLETTITSLDPNPRAGIDELCDVVIRQPLEEVDLGIFDDLQEGDILFFDGSHRAFMGSDVTVFFLEVLPRIAPGVLIHVHDIFWPSDYPARWGPRYYNEQYMLGLLLIHGRYRTIFPSAFIRSDPELKELALELKAMTNPDRELRGASFWLQATEDTSR